MSLMTEYTQLPTYDKLVDVIKVYLNRYDEDTLDTIHFFINAAEKTILRNLRMPAMEKIVSFTIDEYSDKPEEGWVPMPYDYLEMKHVWVEGLKSTTLQRVPFDQIIAGRSKIQPRTAPSGERSYEINPSINIGLVDRPTWAITADRLYLCGVNTSDNIYMTYYADVPELHPDTQTNVLLDLVPDAFAYLAIAEGFRFLMEEQKSDYWESKGQQRLSQVMAQVQEAEFAGSPLTIQYNY